MLRSTQLVRSVAIAIALAWLLPLTFAACAKNVPSHTDDATITARVKTALLNDSHVAATNIQVATSNGVVNLAGSVPSKAEEMRAVEIARQTPGVRDVRSQLQVSSTPQS
jgi:osmotically-inducible protein OsmY